MPEYKDSKYIKEKFNDYYIIHGANLTTLRIADYKSETIKYLNKNLEILESHYPSWYNNHLIKEMGFKKRLFFYLLKRKKFKLLLFLLGKR